MRHAWSLKTDNGSEAVYACIRCQGRLTSLRATPDDASCARTWTLGAERLRLKRGMRPPRCAGMGKVKMTLVGNRWHKERV